MRKSCLTFALDRLLNEGGYLLLRKSIHWEVAHVMHLDKDKETIEHFVPCEELQRPWHALFGFDGKEAKGDADPADRMSVGGIVGSAAIALVVIVCWAIRVKLTRSTSCRKTPPANFS